MIERNQSYSTDIINDCNKPSNKKFLSINEKLNFISNIPNIPAMPLIVINVISKLNNPTVSSKEVEESISMDPALVSYILMIINSPFYNMRSEVLTISRALSLIGLGNLKTLIIGYGIQTVYSNLEDKKTQKQLWEHSVSVGIFAKLISEEFFKVVHSEAYVCGLLHDIGKIILYMHDPEKFKTAIKSRKTNFVDSEFSCFGFSHIETGYFILTKFGFSRNMKNIVLFHHDPEYSPNDDNMPWIIGFANELSHYIKDYKCNNISKYLGKFKFSDVQLKNIIKNGEEHTNSQLSSF